jgi:hypothetical protein
MRYEAIPILGRGEIEGALNRNNPGELSYVVLSAALYSDDAEWAENVCMSLAKHEDPNVRGNAVLGLGHIARIHTKLTESGAKPVIEAALKDESDYVRGQASVAADDAEFFLGWRLARGERRP